MFSLALEVRVYHFLGCLDISRVDLDEFLGDGLEIDLSRYPSATLTNSRSEERRQVGFSRKLLFI